MTEDVLTDGKGECVICLEELQSGDLIARLPCLCIYHKKYVQRCNLTVILCYIYSDINVLTFSCPQKFNFLKCYKYCCINYCKDINTSQFLNIKL